MTQIRRIEVIFAGDTDEGEQRIAAGIGQCGAHALGIGGLGDRAHRRQSEAIHSPEAWASQVVKRTRPASLSIAVVCTVAISCCPSVLRTMSRPLESGA